MAIGAINRTACGFCPESTHAYFDVYTIASINITVNAVLAGLLLFFWYKTQRDKEMLLLACAFGCGAMGGSLMGIVGQSPNLLWSDIGYAIIFLGGAIIWQVMRVFERRRLRVDWMCAGTALWLGVVLLFSPDIPVSVRLALVVGIPFVYTVLSSYELWRGKRERLPSKIPLAVVIMVGAFALLIKLPLTLWNPSLLKENSLAFHGSGTAIMMLIYMCIAIALAFFMLSMIKERVEARQTAKSLIDPLTQMANRLAFMERAPRVLARLREAGEPTCLIVIDLDYFKKINDRYGHGEGDKVLRFFAEVASLKLRPNDHLYRIGGEEFICILQSALEKDAVSVMERVGRSLSRYVFEDDRSTNKTIVSMSAGVAFSGRVGYDLEELTKAADKALYQAKAAGRNCVRIYEGDGPYSGLPALPSMGV